MNLRCRVGTYSCQLVRRPPHDIEARANTVTNSDPTDNILGVIEAAYDAWAVGDADAFAAVYTDDATVVQPGILKTSREQIRTTMAVRFAGPLKGSRVIDQPHSVRLLGSDAAVVITEGGIVMAGESEVPAERKIRATWVLTKRDDQWYVAAFQNSPAH
jgi:uncharacterized protein (TIGR02246 family)